MFGKKQNQNKTAKDTREWYFERERLTVNFQPPAGMINLESTIVSAFTGYSIVSSNVSMALCFVSFFSEGCNRFLKPKLSAWHWWQANCKVSLSWKQRSVAIWLSMNVHPWRAFYFFSNRLPLNSLCVLKSKTRFCGILTKRANKKGIKLQTLKAIGKYRPTKNINNKFEKKNHIEEKRMRIILS